MQDRRLHIDESFTDKAWGEMQKLLDQEMPVARKRKRLAWWWLGLLASGLVVGIALLGKYSNKKIKPVQTVQNQPVASSTLPSAGEATSAENSAKPAEWNTSPSFNGYEPISANTRINTVNLKQKVQSLTQVSSAKNIANTVSDIHVFAPNPNESTANNQTSFLKTTPESSIQLADNQVAGHGFVSFLSLKQLGFKNREVEGVKPFDSRSKTCYYSIQTSVLALPNFSSGGASIEFLAEKYLKGDKLKLGAGIGYTYLRQPIYTGISYGFSSVSADTLGKVIFANANNGAADEIFDISLSNFESQVLQLHYFQLPVQISYQLNKRLSANVGGIFSLLLTSKSEFVSNGLLNDIASLKRSNSESYYIQEKSNIAITDYSLFGGIGLQLTKKASLHMDYIHGMKDVISLNRTNDVNRTLKLGFRYQICGR